MVGLGDMSQGYINQLEGTSIGQIWENSSTKVQ